MPKTNKPRVPGYKLSISGWIDCPLTNNVVYGELQTAIAVATKALNDCGFNLTVDFYPDRRTAD